MIHLFRKKKSIPPNSPVKIPGSLRLTVIPEAFYGGADPVIYASSEVGRQDHRVGHNKRNKVSPPEPETPRVPRKLYSRRRIITVSIFLFLLFVGATTWYYVREGKRTVPTPTRRPPPPTVVTPPLQPIPTTTIAVPPPEKPAPTTSTDEGDFAIPFRDRLGSFPAFVLLDAPDTDADQLTDEEEELFTIDSGIWDSDGDGYYDGQEVVNLYNPKGFAPVKIIDSGLVREYQSPLQGYSVYYPNPWLVAEVDSAGSDVVISAANGDFIEIRAVTKRPDESFAGWFTRTTAGANENFQDLVTIRNRFNVELYERRDHLVAYHPTESLVFVLVYHPSQSGPLSYRRTMIMVIQSFHIVGERD